ncbi:MAG TPA: response regulator [Anaerolineae bacterium]|nr:response regulator [Anaerolineae bacterium]
MPNESGHILVVDDHSTNRLKLSLGLKKQGHTVEVAENGLKALAMLGEQSFDLVLLDIVMPELDGYEVLATMKADPCLRDIPVIVISALEEMDSIVKGIELGAQDYLPKTFDPVLLRARIGACLEKKRFRDQEIEYLRQVERLTEAAVAVESETFDLNCLAEVAARSDALGQLARVFQQMADKVYTREQRLKQQVQELRIEIDQAKQARQVTEITGTDYFQSLRSRASNLRQMLQASDSQDE